MNANIEIMVIYFQLIGYDFEAVLERFQLELELEQSC